MFYYKFSINEWALHTSHLCPDEESVYFRLINHYYDTEAPIPKETESVIRRLRLTQYENIVNTILKEFFDLQNDGWHHKRCDEEISKYHAKAEVNQRIGKLGGRPKKTESVISGNPDKTLIKNKELIIKNKDIKASPVAPKVAIPIGVDESLWHDFLTLRRAKKLPVTATALKGIANEAVKANKSLAEVLQICCERGWGGFKASWEIEPKTTKTTQEWRTNDSLMMAKANELGLHTIGLQRFEIINKIDATLRSRGL